MSRPLRPLTFVLAACGASGPPPERSAPGPAAPQGSAARVVAVVGHRGARGHAPENTLEGFARALEFGVTMLELDVGMSADDVVVVHHDERLNPDTTRNAAGEWVTAPLPTLRSLTFAELAALDVGRLRPGSAYAARFREARAVDGARIPRLADVLAAAERATGGDVLYDIETKRTPTDPTATAPVEPFVAALLAEIDRAGVSARVVIQSFDWSTLRLVRARSPAIRTACLTTEDPEDPTVRRHPTEVSPWLGVVVAPDASVAALAREAGCAIWSPDARDVTREGVVAAHALGLQVFPWTVNEPADLDAILALGVDGVITDYPDRLHAALRRAGLRAARP